MYLGINNISRMQTIYAHFNFIAYSQAKTCENLNTYMVQYLFYVVNNKKLVTGCFICFVYDSHTYAAYLEYVFFSFVQTVINCIHIFI